ncbi:MAG: sulfurtransferase TusE [Gammaproteobacteria bacterium]|nr:sulfurtransferase TusE [Gammaproteobacteria bacterium]|tara:strand:- start:1086 stop:1400 length:315 start_codon:yes stop_codon:yes gene_type:complete
MALELDDNGYLQNLEDWDEDAAHQLAQLESVQLTREHWELIELTRRYYAEFDYAPAMRPLVNWIKLEAGAEKGNSIYLHKLFPVSPARQLARVSGLPKPTKCLY